MKRIPPEEEEEIDIKKIYKKLEKYFSKMQLIQFPLVDSHPEIIEDAKQQYKIDIYSDFNLEDIRQKDYLVRGVFKPDLLIHDLMQIIAIIDVMSSPFMFKQASENGNYYQIVRATQSSVMKKLKTINICIGEKTISVWEILISGKNINFFTYAQVSFYSDDPRIFSIFRGFPYQPLRTFDKNVIGLFLKHFIHVICSKNMEVFQYLCSWFAFLFQKPGVKIGTAIVMVGMQGTGKTIFTNAICRLLGIYGVENANINNITGKHNSEILDKILIVVNEVDSCYGLKSDSSNILKTLITEKSIDINPKHKETYATSNVANFIFVSNNFVPIMIEPDDRRYCVIEVNDDYKENHDFFGQLHGSFAVG